MYLYTTSCQGMQQIQFRDLLNHIGLPTAFFAVGFGIFYGAGFDFVLASAIFELEGGQWRLTNHWLFSDVLHSGSRLLNNIILANLLGFWLYQQMSSKTSSERTIALTKLVLSLLLSFSVVALLKRVLPAECPWDLQQFSGNLPFIGVFADRPAGMHPTQCFPAGRPRQCRLCLGCAVFLLFAGVCKKGPHWPDYRLTSGFTTWRNAATARCPFFLTRSDHALALLDG